VAVKTLKVGHIVDIMASVLSPLSFSSSFCAPSSKSLLRHSSFFSHILNTTLPLSLSESYVHTDRLSRVVVLGAALRVSLEEAATAAGRLCGAAALDARRAVLAQDAAEAEEDGGEEEAGERGPGKAEQVTADVGLHAS
jgi:hypothetical protein